MAMQNGKPVKVAAKGDSPNTSAPGPSPAPVTRVRFNDPFALSEGTHNGGYGENRYAGPSSQPGRHLKIASCD